MINLKKRIAGLLIPHFKNTADSLPQPIPIPPDLLVKLPMSMHSGSPANPLVKAGDYVKVGQLIGEAVGTVSSPVHASVSGTVKSVETADSITGEKGLSVIKNREDEIRRLTGQLANAQSMLTVEKQIHGMEGGEA